MHHLQSCHVSFSAQDAICRYSANMWLFKLTRMVQEQHTIPNHVLGIVDFHTHQDHGWEHLLLTCSIGVWEFNDNTNEL